MFSRKATRSALASRITRRFSSWLTGAVICTAAFAPNALGGFNAESSGAPLSRAAERVLVLPANDEAATRLRRFQSAEGQTVDRVFPSLGGIQVVRLPPGVPVEEAVARCRASGLVRFAEPDYVVRAASTLPDDPRFQDGTQWALNNYGQGGGWPDADVDAPEGWDVATEAPGLVVAVVDSGIRATHEDLAANLWSNPADGTHGYNAITGGHDVWDDHGHGTHLAGIIGAVGNNGKGMAGVAWNVRIMACKFLDSTGNGFTSDAIACIDFARTNGARVLNLSWGGPDYSEALSNALWFARADGILVAAAAGNNAANLDATPFYPASFGFDNQVAVGASTRSETVWPASSYGAARVQLFAPGAAIYSAGNAGDAAYASRSGTSMAAACVAGALALSRAREPDAPSQALRDRLLAAVDRAPAYAGKCETGGRLNLRKLLDRPRLYAARVAGTTNTGVSVRVNGWPGHGYVLESSPDLLDWSPLATNHPPNGEWVYESQTATAERYFRPRPED